MIGDVKVKCRRCNNEALSKELVLDPDYKMMVCRNCVSEKKRPKEEPKEEEKPPGWDAEDVELEKLYRQKKKTAVGFEVREIDEFLQLTCESCNYKFNYDPDTQKPNTCPYCSKPIPKI